MYMCKFKIIIVLFFFYFYTLLYVTNAGKSKNCKHIVTRYKWGGRAPTKVEYSIYPLQYVIVHHTVTEECNSELTCSELLTNIQSYHMDTLNYQDIGYNFLIGGDGKVYEGVGWHKIGAHTIGYNSRSLGIALIGDFTISAPNAAQINGTLKLLKCGVQLGELTSRYKLLAARQVSATQSPGLKLYQIMQDWNNWAQAP